ncbi:MAG: hypothetical protein J3K34DRAFT_375797 [Monoraphidium minutum]|nr:MAG: hypothetical protein J3K34DRAFT_375797 [Monoraphidium minutum]
MKLGRRSHAFLLLALLCVQTASANPLTQGFLKNMDCKGVCKRSTSAAKFGKAAYSCPEGYTLEQDKLGLPHCVKRTQMDCPKGTTLNAQTNTCCPPDNLCFPSLHGLCPHGMDVRLNCSDKVKIGKGLPPARMTVSEVVKPDQINDPAYSAAMLKAALKLPEAGAKQAAAPRAPLPSRPAAARPGVLKPEAGKKPAGTVYAVASDQKTSHGRKLKLLETLLNPAVTVNAERFQPLVVLPKPIVSFGVPPSANVGFVDPIKFPRPHSPVIILPKPALEFIPPNIEVTLPDIRIPQRDMIIPVLPVPPVSFFPPNLETDMGGLNIVRKMAVIDASRLGPRTAFEINPPPIDFNIVPPVQVEIKPPGQTIIDLSRFGPEDNTVVRLPDYKIKIPDPVKIITEPSKIHVVNLGAAQSGPVYEFQLPGLPQRNKIDITLPRVNFTGVTLPGNRNKDLVIVNVQNPDMPPDHQVKVVIDESRAAPNNFPLPIKVNGVGDVGVTNMVELPPITVPDFGTIVTLDARHNSTAPNITLTGLNDLEVVRVTLPDPPKIGRDVRIKFPDVNVNRFIPAGIKPGDDGGLNLTTTVIDATLPSFNVIPALNKPFFKPANFSLSTKGNGAGKGAWGVSVTVEDTLIGGQGPVSPIKIGGPLRPDSAIGIVRDAVLSYIDDESGQFCQNKCCPKCKARPVKIEYAQLIVKCPAGCEGTADGGACVCSAAQLSACPAGKVPCDTAHGATGLCIDASMHAMACKPLAALCTAKKQLVDCA